MRTFLRSLGVVALAAALAAVGSTTVEARDGGGSEPAGIASNLLLARYTFDECDVSDSSRNGLDGVVEGSLACGPGVGGGQAFVFDGAGYASVDAESLGASTSQPRTISLWANPSAVPLSPGAAGLISKYLHFDVGQSNFYASLYQLPGGRIHTVLTGDGTNVLDAPVGTLNEWQHYVFVIAAGPNRSRIYRNGILVAAGTLNLSDALTTQPLRIGNIVGADADQVFRGMLDNVTIFRKVLTEEQIRQLALDP